MQKKSQILCIGHLCHDLVDGKYQLGGAASFAGLLASKLGYDPKIMTSVGEDFEFHKIFEDSNIKLFNKTARYTTVFENQYQDGIRTQTLHHVATKLASSDVPPGWQNIPIVLFCPIADELDVSMFNAFPNALTGITLQGCLRKWDKSGKVSSKAMDWNLLANIDIVFLSDSDLGNHAQALPLIIQKAKLVVMTHGKDGATVFEDHQKHHFPAYPVQEVDPTGAGDTFAMSFLVKYAETKNITHAAAYAHAAASLMVEKNGFDENITNQKIKERYQTYLRK